MALLDGMCTYECFFLFHVSRFAQQVVGGFSCNLQKCLPLYKEKSFRFWGTVGKIFLTDRH